MNKEQPKQTDEKGNPLTYWGGLEEPKDVVLGYKTSLDAQMLDKVRLEKSTHDYSGVHFRHCYQGEYEDGCKYGEDDCPAKPLEPKQETQGYICPETKKQCDDECCVSAEDCHTRASIGILSYPKQETTSLEEAAEILYPYDGVNEDYTIDSKRWSFILGAKWQQERMYSEEDILKLVDNLFHKYSSDFRVSAKIDVKESFKQFKKK